MIAIIVAKSRNNVIGKNNDLPWYLPEDLRHFKKLTSGHTTIMGKNTYLSIYNRINGPLPNRQNIVISRSLQSTPNGFVLASSIKQALELANDSDIFIIGGAKLYESCLQDGIVDIIYMTEINSNIEGDTKFPDLDNTRWEETAREEHKYNNLSYSFITLERRK